MRERTLFDPPADPPTIQERFEQFHAQHPDIYALFKQMAFQLLRAGHERYGAKSIMETIRFHRATSTEGHSGDFKINNIYTSRFVRMLIEEHPEFQTFFELRRLQSD